jgi:glycine/D-amino acid oxidase-like deaminating enzyme
MDSIKKFDTIIVGQGIAGSLLAFMLHRKKIPFILIDRSSQSTASQIAAGMFTPLSGKRKTIHPLSLQQIPFAINVYKEISKLIEFNILNVTNIYQLFDSIEEQSQLQSKFLEPSFAPYVQSVSKFLSGTNNNNGAYEVTHSGWVNCESWMKYFKIWLKKNGRLLEANFVYPDLQINEDKMEYKGLEFKNIFFCEGYNAINNPFFNEIIIPCKGDVLTIASEHFTTDKITKKNGIYIVPSQSNSFKVGATYQWNNNSEIPSEASRLLIESELKRMLVNPYKVINHQSAIRPTTQNREVVVRQHQHHKGMYMFNGLGTKGVLQGPWWANQIVELFMQSQKE